MRRWQVIASKLAIRAFLLVGLALCCFVAIPLLILWFRELIQGFDDFPIGWVLISLVLGLVFFVLLCVFGELYIRNNLISQSVKLTCVVYLFSLAVCFTFL